MVHPEYWIKRSYRHIRHMSKALESGRSARSSGAANVVLDWTLAACQTGPRFDLTYMDIVMDVLKGEISCLDIRLRLVPPLR